MNILAVDCAVSRLCVAVKYNDNFISKTLDIGMKQSEMLVPVIDDILSTAGITAKDLDATALTVGPGSFTGLRLGISALKAIELAYGVPVYGISSLEAYAHPFMNTGLPVLSCIDANKDKFYSSITKLTENKTEILLKEDDREVQDIISAVQKLEKVILAGPDAKKLKAILENEVKDTQFFTVDTHFDTAEALTAIAENMMEQKKEPLKDYDGPVYLRASEAELKLNGQI